MTAKSQGGCHCSPPPPPPPPPCGCNHGGHHNNHHGGQGQRQQQQQNVYVNLNVVTNQNQSLANVLNNGSNNTNNNNNSNTNSNVFSPINTVTNNNQFSITNANTNNSTSNSSSNASSENTSSLEGSVSGQVSGVVTGNVADNVSGQVASAQQNSGFSPAGAIAGGYGGGGAAIEQQGVESGIIHAGAAGGRQDDESSREEERTKTIKDVIQAFCFDDKDVPHPASQVFAERDIEQGYAGEVYRCIAGTHMQVTIARWREQISFAGGQTISCGKGEALYHMPGANGGRLICRTQIPARDCNERSLLRRYGAGIKVLTIVITEKYTAHRRDTQHTTSSSSGSTNMTFDGGRRRRQPSRRRPQDQFCEAAAFGVISSRQAVSSRR